MKSFLIRYLPFLGKYKRFLVAFLHAVLPAKKSYAQHKEDLFIWETLSRFDLRDTIYADVGANHPSDISNTYLLYRKGMSGVLIEPNREFIDLYRKFRKRDVAICAGCSNVNEVLAFHVSPTPVVSSFIANDAAPIYKTAYVPVMELDGILRNIPCAFLSFLNVDVEGLNTEVLKGAAEVLKKTLVLCIEFDSEDEKAKIISYLANDFIKINTIGCNLIFINRKLSESVLK